MKNNSRGSIYKNAATAIATSLATLSTITISPAVADDSSEGYSSGIEGGEITVIQDTWRRGGKISSPVIDNRTTDEPGRPRHRGNAGASESEPEPTYLDTYCLANGGTLTTCTKANDPCKPKMGLGLDRLEEYTAENRCKPSNPKNNNASSKPATEVFFEFTSSDLAKLNLKSPGAKIGPERGWIPTGLKVALQATEANEQTITTTMNGAQVTIKARPVRFIWDMGDGTQISTTKPGQPYPNTNVYHVYKYGGWYDVTLTTEYTGEYQINGGSWHKIQGQAAIQGQPRQFYSKEEHTHLTTEDYQNDPLKDFTPPRRTPETEGRKLSSHN